MFSGAGSWKGVHPHQRIEEYAKALSVLGDVEAAVAYASLLVADENHEQEQYAINLIRKMQATGGPVGDWTGLAIPLDNYVDSVYFARSDQNRGIQLDPQIRTYRTSWP